MRQIKPHELHLLIILSLLQTIVYFVATYRQLYDNVPPLLHEIATLCERFLAEHGFDGCDTDDYAAAVLNAYVKASKSLDNFNKLIKIIANFGGDKFVA